MMDENWILEFAYYTTYYIHRRILHCRLRSDDFSHIGPKTPLKDVISVMRFYPRAHIPIIIPQDIHQKLLRWLEKQEQESPRIRMLAWHPNVESWMLAMRFRAGAVLHTAYLMHVTEISSQFFEFTRFNLSWQSFLCIFTVHICFLNDISRSFDIPATQFPENRRSYLINPNKCGII